MRLRCIIKMNNKAFFNLVKEYVYLEQKCLKSIFHSKVKDNIDYTESC